MKGIFVIDLRNINPDDAAIWDILSPERKEKIQKLKMSHSKLESIGAELALIKAVKHFYPDTPLPLRYYRNSHGKPYLSDFPNLHISISHSGDYAVCAVSDTEVGIDIQKIKEANFRIADRYFTIEEREYIGEDTRLFFDLWSRKESYVKATGTGLTVPLNSFSTLHDTAAYRFLTPDAPTDEYIMRICEFNE